MNFIVAVTNDYAVGKNNDLLFHLPTDLKYFKATTLNKVVVMGDKTYYSLPKRPLPNRITIVLSNNPEFNEPLPTSLSTCPLTLLPTSKSRLTPSF